MSNRLSSQNDRALESDTALAEVMGYWNQKARKGNTDCERIECSRRAQRMRFETFLLYHDLTGKTVLDVGCGTGDFWDHLQVKGVAADYTGIDLSEEMISRCRERFPGVRFESGNILVGKAKPSFDYTVSFGIHNIKVELGREILELVTRRQFDLCRVAAHVSILTDRYEGFAAHIQPWRAEEILTVALDITPYVVLRHDYLPNDFSVTLYREPLIDTLDDLLLD